MDNLVTTILEGGDSPSEELIPIISDFVIVWLDEHFNDTNNENLRQSVMELQKVVKTVQTFHNAEECIYFIENSSERTVFMIISETQARDTVPVVQKISHVNRIYILYENTPHHELWLQQYPKVKDSFSDITSMEEAIKNLIKRIHRNELPISFIKADSITPKTTLDQLDQSFMYTQILKEILFEVEFRPEHMNELYTYWCKYFLDDPVELQNIERFTKEYRRGDAIRWYSSESFLYPIVNKALRVMDVDLIVVLGFFLRDLHQNLAELHPEQFPESNYTRLPTLYRGQGLSLTKFDKLQKTNGGLLSFNSFLSTTADRDVAYMFAASNASDPDLVGILFEISGMPWISTACFADISHISAHKDEEEILFSMHTVFRVSSITRLDTSDRLWLVALTFTMDDDPQLTALTQYISTETVSYNGWYRLGILLLKLGKISRAEQLYLTLLNNVAHDEERAYCHNHIGLSYSEIGQYSKALSNYEKALEIQQNSLPEDHLSFATSYNNIGSLYTAVGAYSKALSNYEKALEVEQKSLPDGHPDIATSYNNMGVLYYRVNDYSKALSNYEKALEIDRESLPKDHPSLGTSYSNIGSLYSKMGDYSQALSNYEKALEIKQRSLPQEHPDVAGAYNNIGSLYSIVGEYSKALSNYEKALEIQQKSLSHDHPSMATCYGNIGLLYSKMGEYSNALSNHEKALEIRQKSLPEDHPDIAASYNNIGLLYSSIGEYSKELLNYEKALEIQQKSLPPDHSDIATSYSNIGSLCIDMGEYAKALSNYEKALEIQRKSLPEGHPDIGISYNNLGLLYSKMNVYSKATLNYEKALEIQQNSLPEDHPDIPTAYNNIGRLYSKMGEYSKALLSFEKALEVSGKSLPLDDPEIATSYRNIGSSYIDLGEYAKALSNYAKALEIEQASPRMNQDRIVALQVIITFLYWKLSGN